MTSRHNGPATFPNATTVSPKRCIVCAHADCGEMDAALRADVVSMTALAATHGVQRLALTRHRLQCLGLPKRTRSEAARKALRIHRINGRRCKICRHPACDAINAALSAGVPATHLAYTYGDVSDHKLLDHRHQCLGLTPVGRRGKSRSLLALLHQGASMASTAPSPSFTTLVTQQIAQLSDEVAALQGQLATLTQRLTAADTLRDALCQYLRLCEHERASRG